MNIFPQERIIWEKLSAFTTSIQYCFRQCNKARKTRHINWKNEVNRSFIHGCHTWHCIKSQVIYNRLFKLTKELSKGTGYMNTIQKLFSCLYINNKQLEIKINKNIIYHNIKIYEILKYKFDKSHARPVYW